MTSRKAAIYLRVSTDKQTTETQRQALEAVAFKAGWEVVAIYEDAGISGSKGRDRRPGLDQALNDAIRRRYDVLMTWSVDRLGRSLRDLVSTLGDLQACGVDLYLDKQALDTATPAGKAMFQMLGVFAEFERSIISERVKAGMARAKENNKPIGRPKVSPDKEKTITRYLSEGVGINRTARLAGVGSGTVQRIKAEMKAA